MAAIQAYRNLLRAARIAFEGTKQFQNKSSCILCPLTPLFVSGDVRMLDAAKQSIRQGFRDKASLPPSDPSIAPAIQHAEEVASFLKANLVQGRREGDTYSKTPQATIAAPKSPY